MKFVATNKHHVLYVNVTFSTAFPLLPVLVEFSLQYLSLHRFELLDYEEESIRTMASSVSGCGYTLHPPQDIGMSGHGE